MMKTLRDNTHIIMIVVAVMFIGLMVLDWGMDLGGLKSGRQNVAGQVNDEKIQYEELRNEYEQLRELERNRRGGELDDSADRQLIRQAWDQHVQHVLLKQQIARHKITVSDGELLQYIKDNPLEEIKQQELFLTDGKFDQNKYLAALKNPSIQGLELYEARYRSILPQQKLIDHIISAARVTDLEVRRAYLAQNEKATVKYVFFDAAAFANEKIAVTDGEINAHYTAHQDDFKQGLRAKLEYVVVEKKPSQQDEGRVKRQAEDLLRQVRTGADFAKLAAEFSEDPGSAQKGGDLGFFGRGTMVKAFEDAAFQTPTGEIADPVHTPFGWHLIKVEARKTENGAEQVQARHILLKVTTGQRTLETFRARMQTLLDAAKTTGLRPAARAQKVAVLETDFFQKRDDGYIPRIGYLPGAVGFAFREKEGRLSDILENESGFYILRVAGRKPEGIQALSEVKEQIKTTLTTNKRKERAKKQAEAFMTKLSGKTFDRLAGADTALVKTAGPVARQGFIPGIGQDPAFAGATFRLTKPGQLSGLVEGERGYYLIQLVERQPIDETKFASEKETLRQQLLQQKQTQLYTDWYENIKSQAKIEDRLSEFFVY